MSASILQYVLRCLLWLGLGTLAMHAVDVQALPWSDQGVAPMLADGDAAADADRGPVPQDRGKDRDPAKRRHASRRLESAVGAVSAPALPDALTAWPMPTPVAAGEVAMPAHSGVTPRSNRTQRSALHRRQLRALRGRAPPDPVAAH